MSARAVALAILSLLALIDEGRGASSCAPDGGDELSAPALLQRREVHGRLSQDLIERGQADARGEQRELSPGGVDFLSQEPNEEQRTAAEQPERKPRGSSPLVLIPGLGQKRRIPSVLENIRLLREELGPDFRCLLVIHSPGAEEELEYMADRFAPCHVHYRPVQMWHAIKAVTAEELAGSDSVFLMLDDHRLEASTLAKLRAVMATEDVELVSATDVDLAEAPGWCKEIKSRPGEIARGSRYTDFGVGLISLKAFQCMQDIADPETNGIGHGYDNMFVSLCKVPVALCDTCVTDHLSWKLGGSSYSTATAASQKEALRKKLGAVAEGWSECPPGTTFPLPGGSRSHPLLLASVHLAGAARGLLGAELAMMSPEQLLQLHRLQQGSVTKAQLEVVLAQYDEDVSWSEVYAPVRTVYCKGDPDAVPGCLPLPNVGREGHTFLHHIVSNYDRLADWTVFSQAGEPTTGYKGHRLGGGHMLPGVSFHDYALPGRKTGLRAEAGGLFVFTSALNLTSTHISIRESYERESEQKVLAHQTSCPKAELGDAWEPWMFMDWFGAHLAEKCSVDVLQFSPFLKKQWQELVGALLPPGDAVFYAQGARFAASRERIRERPREFYERLLARVSESSDPCTNYLYEWFWANLIGQPRPSPCPVDDLPDESTTLAQEDEDEGRPRKQRRLPRRRWWWWRRPKVSGVRRARTLLTTAASRKRGMPDGGEALAETDMDEMVGEDEASGRPRKGRGQRGRGKRPKRRPGRRPPVSGFIPPLLVS